MLKAWKLNSSPLPCPWRGRACVLGGQAHLFQHCFRAISQPHFNHSRRLSLLPQTQESHQSFGEDVRLSLLSEG